MPLVVHNETRQTLLGDQIEVAATAFARLKGLLGRDGLAEGGGLLITPCNSIHMFFMRFAIDVAFLDRDGRVVRAVHGIRPWRATRVYLEAQSTLELPEGTLARTETREGDRLRLEERG